MDAAEVRMRFTTAEQALDRAAQLLVQVQQELDTAYDSVLLVRADSVNTVGLHDISQMRNYVTDAIQTRPRAIDAMQTYARQL